ncbi:hypothetical protein L2E82_00945 [Cichorium intybus]|uniref:Uncharacterized protein n=1 Tax=Cichorium intybus TaxID=13427 RepID=A0ACB9GY03_CICIN|nr:hypothetical protein L2E82_00945 [Cichorium intybus]
MIQSYLSLSLTMKLQDEIIYRSLMFNNFRVPMHKRRRQVLFLILSGLKNDGFGSVGLHTDSTVDHSLILNPAHRPHQIRCYYNHHTAILLSPSPSTSPLVTLRQKRRRSLKKIKVSLDMDVDKAPDNPKNVEPDSETVTNVESIKISSPDTTVSSVDMIYTRSETSAISEVVAAKAAGIELSHDMLGGDNIRLYVRPGNGSCPRTMDLVQSSLFRRYVCDMPERVFHQEVVVKVFINMFSWYNLNIQKEEACKQLVKLFIKVKLLPNGDYIQKEAALWIAFKPK